MSGNYKTKVVSVSEPSDLHRGPTESFADIRGAAGRANLDSIVSTFLVMIGI